MVVPLTERRKGDNPMNETAERVEKPVILMKLIGWFIFTAKKTPRILTV